MLVKLANRNIQTSMRSVQWPLLDSLKLLGWLTGAQVLLSRSQLRQLCLRQECTSSAATVHHHSDKENKEQSRVVRRSLSSLFRWSAKTFFFRASETKMESWFGFPGTHIVVAPKLERSFRKPLTTRRWLQKDRERSWRKPNEMRESDLLFHSVCLLFHRKIFGKPAFEILNSILQTVDSRVWVSSYLKSENKKYTRTFLTLSWDLFDMEDRLMVGVVDIDRD